jgi:hypothetical protein
VRRQTASPIYVELPIGSCGLPFRSFALCDQIHSIDKKRLGGTVLGLKSGVKIEGFIRIGRKLRIGTEIYAAVDQSFIELASGLQRFQLVNSMQDFLSPHYYERRVG